MNFDEKYWNTIVPKKIFLSTSDVIKLGLFGSKGSWYRAIKAYNIPIFYISDHRMLAYREDVIKFLVERSHLKKKL